MSEIEETIARLRASVTANPNNPITRLGLGKAYHQGGRIDEALSSVQRATALKADYFDAFVTLGMLHRVRGDAAQAAVALTQAVQLKPTAVDVWLDLARARRDAELKVEAVEAYGQVIAARPDDLEALRDGGLLSHEVGRHEQAAAWLGKAVLASEACALDGALQLALARSSMKLGLAGPAVVAFGKAVTAGVESADVRREEGEALLATEARLEALRSFERALELDASRADLAERVGKLARELDKLEVARASFAVWTTLAPDDAEAFFSLGTVLSALGRTEEAIAPLAQALRLAPARHDVALAYALALQAVARLREAVAVLEPHLATPTAPWQIAILLADLYLALARAKDARRQLEEACARWPDVSRVHHALAVSLAATDDVDQAEAAYARASQLDPANASSKLGWADMQLLRGTHATALVLFDELRRTPMLEGELLVAALRGYGECALALARPMEAVEALHAAVQAAGSNVKARERVGLGLGLLELGRLAEAEAMLAGASELGDEQFASRAESGLGDVKVKLGKLDEARSAYRRALLTLTANEIDDSTEGSSNTSRLSRLVAPTEVATKRQPALAIVDASSIRARLASVSLELGRPDEALTISEHGLSRRPDHGSLQRVRAAALIALGRTREAPDALSQALWQSPDDPDLVSAMGTVLSALGRDHDAVSYLERAIANDPDDPQLTRAHARTSARLGRVDAALESFSRSARGKHGTGQDWLEVGALEEGRGRFVEAAEAYRKAIKMEPALVDAHRGAGRALHRAGKHEDAAWALRNAVRLHEPDAATHLELARALRDAGKLDEAVASYRRATELVTSPPEIAEVQRDLAIVLIALREDGAAEAALMRATEAQPEKADYHRLLSEVRARLGKPALAAEALEAALAWGDDALPTLLSVAASREAQGQAEGALALYTRAAEKAPNDASASAGVARLLLARGAFAQALPWCDRAIASGGGLAVHVCAAEAAIGADDRNRAWVAVRSALVLAPNDVSVQRLRARLAVRDENWGEATEACEKILVAEPSAFDALRGLGRASQLLGRFQQAQRALEAALAMAPHDHELMISLGRVMLATDRAAAAIPLLLRATDELAQQGASRRALWLEGLTALLSAFLAMGSIGDAQATLERALREGAEDPEMRRQIGEALAARGQHDEAALHFRRVVDLVPADAGTRSLLAVALAMSGKETEAIDEFAKARARGPLLGRASYIYGVCLHRLSRFGEARESYAAAMEQGIRDFDCARALGDTSVVTGKFREAAQAYAVALASRPDDADVRVALALALHQSGAPEEAMEQFRMLRARYPARAEQLFRQLQSLTR